MYYGHGFHIWSNMEQSTSNAASLDAQASATGAIYAKYGEASVAGFQAVPDLLLKHQHDLGLSAIDLVILLNVLMHWWYPGQKPFPRSSTIATRMGITTRTVQRSLQHMEDINILTREKTTASPTYLDPSPLVSKLQALAVKDTDYHIRRLRRDFGKEGSTPNQPLQLG